MLPDDKPNAPMTPREYVEMIVLPTLRGYLAAAQDMLVETTIDAGICTPASRRSRPDGMRAGMRLNGWTC